MKESGELYTFLDCSGQFQFTVKTEFLNRCYRPNDYDTYTLNNTYYITKWLHNPSGPAVVDTVNKTQQWWINGKLIPQEEAERMMHRLKFNDKLLNDVLAD